MLCGRWLAPILVAWIAGCLRTTSFECATSADCTGTAPGTCQSIGYCSFADSSCPSGQRYGEYAGASSNQCVEELGADAGIDASPDAPPDAPKCLASYAAIPGSTHLYRAIATTANFATHRNACAAEGAFLAVPQDLTQLQGVLALAGAGHWVGITDAATEGTFLTVLGTAATFLPWETGQPDNNNGADCVRVSMTTQKYRDERCAEQSLAVCECVP